MAGAAVIRPVPDEPARLSSGGLDLSKLVDPDRTACYRADRCRFDLACGNVRSCLEGERERGAVMVRFHAPRGVGSDDGFTVDRPMRHAPRQGDEVAFAADEDDSDAVDTFRVHVVVWYVDERDFDVYVVLR